ncbi:MAG TPA: IS1380 family transposase [Geobacterales bacterium]|nr:IS1380 family transposase [Geobacterales bacterium]
MTQCIPTLFGFQDLGSREVVAAFDGGKVSSDAGGLLLREVEEKFRFVEQFARCFTDYREADLVEHTVLELIKQRVFGICLGYEDLNDHDQLRLDPLLAVLVGKTDPTGDNRVRARDQGKPLAGKSTLNRLELTAVGDDDESRYKKIVARMSQVENFLVDVFVQQHSAAPPRIVLDLDATDDPIHGHQLGKFFHGYYDCDCYLPLYIFCGDHPLCAALRPSDIDASAGSLVYIQRIVARIREKWPNVKIVLRGDSGFCRDYLMTWCEANNVDFLFGLAKNKRLLRVIGQEMQEAKVQFEQTQKASRVFKDFEYQTRRSWKRARRVVGKAEHLKKGANPRFIVTSLSSEDFDAKTLYEKEYCARGEMENRIKEQQLMMFADRTSCETLRANQVRLYMSTVAYIVMRALREFGLKDTEMAQAQCSTIRVKLLKLGAVIRVTVRRVVVSLSEAFAFREVFMKVWRNLRDLVTPLPIVAPTG